jgi:hypothetical protein
MLATACAASWQAAASTGSPMTCCLSFLSLWRSERGPWSRMAIFIKVAVGGGDLCRPAHLHAAPIQDIFPAIPQTPLGRWWRSPSFPPGIGRRPAELHEMANSQSVPPSHRLLPPSQPSSDVRGTQAATTLGAPGGIAAPAPPFPDPGDCTLETDSPSPRPSVLRPLPCLARNSFLRPASPIQ